MIGTSTARNHHQAENLPEAEWEIMGTQPKIARRNPCTILTLEVALVK
jgi:hypothetical protein